MKREFLQNIRIGDQGLPKEIIDSRNRFREGYNCRHLRKARKKPHKM